MGCSGMSYDAGETSRSIFNVSDALQIELARVGDSITGSQSKAMRVGPFVLKFNMNARGTIHGDGLLGVVVHFRGNLWAYVHANSVKHTLCLVFFDGKGQTFKDFESVDAKSFMEKMATRLKASFMYSKECWNVVDYASLLF